MLKNIVYAEIPEFDQATQYVTQAEPVEYEDHIYIGVEIKDLEIDESEAMMFEGF